MPKTHKLCPNYASLNAEHFTFLSTESRFTEIKNYCIKINLVPPLPNLPIGFL